MRPRSLSCLFIFVLKQLVEFRPSFRVWVASLSWTSFGRLVRCWPQGRGLPVPFSPHHGADPPLESGGHHVWPRHRHWALGDPRQPANGVFMGPPSTGSVAAVEVRGQSVTARPDPLRLPAQHHLPEATCPSLLSVSRNRILGAAVRDGDGAPSMPSRGGVCDGDLHRGVGLQSWPESPWGSVGGSAICHQDKNPRKSPEGGKIYFGELATGSFMGRPHSACPAVTGVEDPP